MKPELQLDLWNMDMRSAAIVSWFVSEIIVNTTVCVCYECAVPMNCVLSYRTGPMWCRIVKQAE